MAEGGALPAVGKLRNAQIEVNIVPAMSAMGELAGGLWWSSSDVASSDTKNAWQRVQKAALPSPLMAAPLAGQQGVREVRVAIVQHVTDSYNAGKLAAAFFGKKKDKWHKLPVAPKLLTLRTLQYQSVSTDPAVKELMTEYAEHVSSEPTAAAPEVPLIATDCH